MTRMRNRVVPNAHFKKHWQKYVKTWFDQPAKKQKRRVRRNKKAAAMAPRPAKGPLRPIVRCPTVKYNMRVRAGRGFSFEELRGAGIPPKIAPTIGISVDHRRKNKSHDSLQINIQRLKEYKSKLILFPRHPKKPRKNETDIETCKMAKQTRSTVMAIKQARLVYEYRKITEDERKYSVFEALRKARADIRLQGVREKRANQKAEEEKDKKKPAR